MTHRWLLPVSLCLLVSTASLRAADPAPPLPARPNIIIILADDMGFSDIGCYGSEIATPNIDRLASEGLRYTQFYNAARCCPTRASLLTGLYPHQVGVGDMVDEFAEAARAKLGGPAYQAKLSTQCVTIAEALHAGGYATFIAGKWHLGEGRDAWPDRRGFDRQFSLINGASNYFGWGPQYKNVPVMLFEDAGEKFVPPHEGFFTTDAFTEHAEQFVRERPADQPFFLYLAYNAPHWPLQEFPENIDPYRGKYLAGWDVLRAQRLAKQKTVLGMDWALSPFNRGTKSWEALDAPAKTEWDTRMAIYAAQITHLDRDIGKLLDTLRQTGQDKNTLVMFLSDNGGCAEKEDAGLPGAVLGTRESYTSYRQAWANVSNTPFRMFKSWTYEGGVATPLVVRWPDGIKQPGLVPGVGDIKDLMPTCLQVAGVAYPKTYEGREIPPEEGLSLAPTFQGGAIPRRTLFWEHEGNRAVLAGETKLVAGFRAPWQLYDLAQDRSELHDLAAAQPERVHALAADYAAWAARVHVRPWELTQAQ